MFTVEHTCSALAAGQAYDTSGEERSPALASATSFVAIVCLKSSQSPGSRVRQTISSGNA
jgi:hypothetical protein